jgi:hypothetical protein
VKHIGLIIISILAVSAGAAAQTYSDANLNGSYSLQFGTPQTYVWSKTFSCPSDSKMLDTVSGTQTGTYVVSGTLTFDGSGGLTFSTTSIGAENQSASANTTSVTWSSTCQVLSVNLGHVVFQAPSTKTGSGTYSIQSSGGGTMSESGSSQSQTLLLAATSNGLSTTVLVTNPQVNGQTIGTGIAVHQ